ncbi:hypothetical protein ACNISN_22730 [Escherichia coli]
MQNPNRVTDDHIIHRQYNYLLSDTGLKGTPTASDSGNWDNRHGDAANLLI